VAVAIERYTAVARPESEPQLTATA